MKLIFATLATFASKAFADYNQIRDGLEQLQAMAENKTEAEYLDAKANRELDTNMLAFLTDVDGYGCWCNFNAAYTQSKGPVQDAMDAICKTLVNGYHCGIIDGVEAGTPCDTPTVAYDAYNYFANFGQSVLAVCASKNPGNTCAETACIVEGQFTFDFFQNFLGGAGTDPNLKHANGFFDADTECSYAGGAGQSVKTCCGAYPNRYPYKTFAGQRDCCGQVTYDTSALQCCTNPLDITIKTTLSIFDTCPT